MPENCFDRLWKSIGSHRHSPFFSTLLDGPIGRTYADANRDLDHFKKYVRLIRPDSTASKVASRFDKRVEKKRKEVAKAFPSFLSRISLRTSACVSIGLGELGLFNIIITLGNNLPISLDQAGLAELAPKLAPSILTLFSGYFGWALSKHEYRQQVIKFEHSSANAMETLEIDKQYLSDATDDSPAQRDLRNERDPVEVLLRFIGKSDCWEN